MNLVNFGTLGVKQDDILAALKGDISGVRNPILARKAPVQGAFVNGFYDGIGGHGAMFSRVPEYPGGAVLKAHDGGGNETTFMLLLHEGQVVQLDHAVSRGNQIRKVSYP